MSTIREQIAAARAMADAATAGEWRWIAKGPREAARAFLTETFDLSDGDTIHGVGIAAPWEPDETDTMEAIYFLESEVRALLAGEVRK